VISEQKCPILCVIWPIGTRESVVLRKYFAPSKVPQGASYFQSAELMFKDNEAFITSEQKHSNIRLGVISTQIISARCSSVRGLSTLALHPGGYVTRIKSYEVK
jgi:hypothetical protein